MKNLLQTLLQNRKILYRILKHTTKEELLRIPEGFRNNVYWNIGHIVVTQQLLIYGRSNLQMIVPSDFVEKFRKGSVPNGLASEEEIDELSGYLFTTIERTVADFEAEVFNSYDGFTTATNFEIKNVDDALVFNLFHEAMHLGIILSLQKVNTNNLKP